MIVPIYRNHAERGLARPSSPVAQVAHGSVEQHKQWAHSVDDVSAAWRMVSKRGVPAWCAPWRAAYVRLRTDTFIDVPVTG
jgi:hypothetical protein